MEKTLEIQLAEERERIAMELLKSVNSFLIRSSLNISNTEYALGYATGLSSAVNKVQRNFQVERPYVIPVDVKGKK